MHWKRDKDQEQCNNQQAMLQQHPRTISGLNFESNPQIMQSFAIPTAHQHHHNYHYNQHHYPQVAIVRGPVRNQPNAIIDDPEDLTEQIRISVQDTHISHRSYYNESGGNISDVHDNIDEENAPTYENIRSLQLRAHNHGFSGLNSSMRQNGNQSNQDDSQLTSLNPQPSTSSSSSPIHYHQGGSQASNSNLVVVDQTDHQDIQYPRAASSGEANISGNPKSLGLSNGEESADINGQSKSNIPIILKLKSQRDQISVRHPKCNNESHQEETKAEPSDNSCVSFQNSLDHVTDNLYAVPPYTHDPQAGVIKNYLFNGSKFCGYQKSQSERYEVDVQIQHVDYKNSYLYGYLNITNLTVDHPSLTTFFEGEIISERYPFLTRKWEATDKIDLAHWSRFDHFAKNYCNVYNLDDFNYDVLKNSDYIYMRWKERFLVPDHTVKKVHGASYEGFYYTCYSKRSSRIKGYYFHIEERIESFQSLDLKLDCRERNSQVYEFR